MRRWTRRQIGALAGAGCLAVFSPRVARGQGAARIVVVGGGVAGATAAKYLAASGKRFAVTLIEPNRSYTTCFFSNLYLAGLRSLGSVTHGYEALAQRHGVNVIHASATTIDPVARTVALVGGATLAYDRLVVAPGIAFKYDAIDGYGEAATETIPHAWNGGPQMQVLRRQLEAMEDGGVFAIAAPPNPSRCPPAPYERASLVAYYFKQFKPRAKILILDAKDSFFEQDLFEDGWRRHYPGMIEWLPKQFTGGVKAVDVQGRALVTPGEAFKFSVANVVPPQIAGALAQRAGLADRSGWCPIDPATFASTIHDGVHVLGDAASAGDMPKSAFAANSQAKACAVAIIASLTGAPPPPQQLFNSCYTLLAPDDAVSEAGTFEPFAGTIKSSSLVVSTVGESDEIRRRAARDANVWYAAFTHDVFG